MYLAVMFFAGRLKFFQIKAVICITAKNLGTIIAANNNMLRWPGMMILGDEPWELILKETQR